jgi:DMSO/TMAO reductase YedYZ molybdopterin-dependent catalytic subunit
MNQDPRAVQRALSRRAFLENVCWSSPARALVGWAAVAPGARARAGLAAQAPPSVGAEVVGGKPRLIVRSARPIDLETPVGLLDSWLTPNDLFYVRSHVYAPEIRLPDWRLEVKGAVERPLELRLDDLKRMPRASVVVTLECAGNGRAFFDPPVAGIQWQKGAVGTARWTGVRLADVLKRAGPKPEGRHVWLDGADRGIGTMPDYIRNLPVAKALDPDTLLAYEMNGEPLPPLHGFPLRAVVPGWEGAYAVKWLERIEVADREHEGFFVQTAYRYPTRRIAPGAPVDPKDMAPLTGLAVKSVLTAPAEGAVVPGSGVRIAGFAWAGEAEVERVDVSTDGGATWQPTRLGADRARYAWRRFELDWRPPEPGSYVILSRAADARGRVQPITPQWNPSGYLWNAVDRVRVDVRA